MTTSFIWIICLMTYKSTILQAMHQVIALLKTMGIKA